MNEMKWGMGLTVMTYNIFPLYIQILHQIRSQMVEVNMSQWSTIIKVLRETSIDNSVKFGQSFSNLPRGILKTTNNSTVESQWKG